MGLNAGAMPPSAARARVLTRRIRQPWLLVADGASALRRRNALLPGVGWGLFLDQAPTPRCCSQWGPNLLPCWTNVLPCCLLLPHAHHRPWAGIQLACHMRDLHATGKGDMRGKRVLELGSGIGETRSRLPGLPRATSPLARSQRVQLSAIQQAWGSCCAH